MTKILSLFIKRLGHSWRLIFLPSLLSLASCQTLPPKATAPTQTASNQPTEAPASTSPQKKSFLHQSSETTPTVALHTPPKPIQIALTETLSPLVPEQNESTPLSPIAPMTYDNLWDELSAHFHYTDKFYKHYQSYQTYFLRRKDYLNRLSQRAKPYLYHIYSEVKKRKMPYEIALLPAVESGFTATAKSYQSAAGLWQFIPGTAHMYDLHKNWWYDGRLDIIHSTRAALDYLSKLYEMNGHDWLLALASYNAGMGNVLKAQRKFRRHHPHQKADFWAIRKYLPKETQNYVPQLFAIANIVKHRNLLGVNLEPIPNQPYLATLPLKRQLNLKSVSQLTGLSMDEIQTLNPGYLRPTTPPTGKHHLVLPKEVAQTFQKNLEQNQAQLTINWTKHKVRPGESLSVIAHRYHTRVSEIKRMNHLKSSRIRAGKTLLIPYPEKFARTVATSSRAHSYKGKRHLHRVKKGESLWTIANYYNISTQTLCRWNNIGIRTPLRVGQKLIIRSNQYGKKIHYTLKKNESLWVVAQKFNTTPTQIAKWNHIRRNKTLQPGDRLTIWVPKNPKYIVKKGDSLWKIAKNYNLSTHKIIQHNDLKNTASLSPGQILYIPIGS